MSLSLLVRKVISHCQCDELCHCWCNEFHVNFTSFLYHLSRHVCVSLFTSHFVTCLGVMTVIIDSVHT